MNERLIIKSCDITLEEVDAIDNAANRCTNVQTGDSEVVVLPTGVTVDAEDATELQVSPRGVFTAVGDTIPLIITTSYGASTRTVTVSATGQITYSNY